MWDLFLGEAGAAFSLPSTVRFYEMRPFALLLNIRVSILSLRLHGERVACERKRRQGPSFCKSLIFNYHKHSAAFVMIIILPSERTQRKRVGEKAD